MNTLVIKDAKSGKELRIATVRTAKNVAGLLEETENDAITELTTWITAELTNNEVATDEELVAYFMREGGLSEEEAREWVRKRSEYLGKL
jgi:hypothetical protein